VCNQSLEDTVQTVVNTFVANETLFTALDVSNEVKKTMPQATHREVRNIVRGLYATRLEPAGWTRSEIDVKLENGDVVKALLYHPLSASWSLDELYDDHRRSQVSAKPTGTVNVDLGAGFDHDLAIRTATLPPDQAYVDLASDKDYTVATTIDRGNVVQTTVFPSVDPIIASLSVDSATAPSLTQPTYNLPPPAAATEEVPPVPSTDVLDSFTEKYNALTNELYAALGVSEEELKDIADTTKTKVGKAITKARNMLSSFLTRK